jgi:hypothetical protein
MIDFKIKICELYGAIIREELQQKRTKSRIELGTALTSDSPFLLAHRNEEPKRAST